MFQLINNNARLFCEPSVQLSTVELPAFADYRYESCLFTASSSEVVERYSTLGEAVAGHARLSRQYSLLNAVNNG